MRSSLGEKHLSHKNFKSCSNDDPFSLFEAQPSLAVGTDDLSESFAVADVKTLSVPEIRSKSSRSRLTPKCSLFYNRGFCYSEDKDWRLNGS